MSHTNVSNDLLGVVACTDKTNDAVGSSEESSVVDVQLENRPLAKLRPHPRQMEIFLDLSDIELQHLADDLRRNGIREPVEILPDGTIIAGHQRCRAAELLGWDKILCQVRHDLAKEGDVAVERRFLESNFNRRQLGPLDRARCYRALRELYHSDNWDCDRDVRIDLRDFLASQFKVSGRTLDRWERVLDAPREVQDACSSNRLTLDQAGKIAGLSREVQQEITARIRAGENPKDVAACYLKKSTTPIKIGTILRRFIAALEKGHADISPRIGEITSGDWKQDLPILKDASKLLIRMIEHIQALPEGGLAMFLATSKQDHEWIEAGSAVENVT
jgi:hypothetical protein